MARINFGQNCEFGCLDQIFDDSLDSKSDFRPKTVFNIFFDSS